MSVAASWHAMPAEEALRLLGSSSGGLTEPEAAVRLARFGPNLFQSTPPISHWVVLRTQLRSVLVGLLVVAIAAALLSGDPLDAGAIAVVLVINVAIGFTLELRAHRAIESLRSLEVTRARVVRSGLVAEVDARGLVVGDVIELEAGRAVPADARLIDAVELSVEEASLTGESAPVAKRTEPPLPRDAPLPDRVTMVYKASAVAGGRARAVVVATGMQTEVGRIGALMGAVKVEPTPLERRLDQLGRRLALSAVMVAVVVAGLGAMQGMPLGEIVQTAIALAVAAVPEALPVVGTIAMAIGVRRMARRHALVRRLPVVETLGSATVICTDKTGTLTAGRMTATVLRLRESEVALADGNAARQDSRVRLALQIGALANRSNQGNGTLGGDPTEVALDMAAQAVGLEPALLRSGLPEIGELPFSARRMLMATFHRVADETVAYVKGAPRRVVELCDRVLTAEGERPMYAGEREELLALNRELAARGLRVLALASRRVAAVDEAELRGLTWVGFIGLSDPPAAGVSETIRAFRAAGIRTVMLTGDQKLTAETVGHAVGLLEPGAKVLDGRDLEQLTDAELRAAVADTSAFSRISPEDKLRIVAAYQQRGEVVAMLGDGVNDAAALRKADIGVAMGGRGTDLAKEAASVILQDDRFPTIAAAIEEGRVTFGNLRKFVFYLFSCNLAEILVMLGAGVAGHPAALLPLQILWLNLLTDTFPALALAVEPGEPAIMRQPPRDPAAALLSARMVRTMVGYAVLIALATLAAFAWGMAGAHGSPARATTLAFTTLAFAQIFHLGNARSAEPVLAPRRALANRAAIAAVIGAAGLQLLAAFLPALARVLKVEPLSVLDWAIVAACALTPAVFGQAYKAWIGRR